MHFKSASLDYLSLNLSVYAKNVVRTGGLQLLLNGQSRFVGLHAGKVGFNGR